MKNAGLKIEPIEAVAYCAGCGCGYPTLKYAKICPNCGSGHTRLLRGNEYNIKEIEARQRDTKEDIL